MDIINDETKPVKKYSHRYVYLNEYARKRYQEDEEYRKSKIEKVKNNYRKRQERLALLELSLKENSLQLV